MYSACPRNPLDAPCSAPLSPSAGTGALAACSDGGGGDHGGGHSPGGAQNYDTYVSPGGKEVEAAEAARGSGPVRKVSLTATRARLDLGGGRTVASWAYGDRLPGREVRVTAGDTLALTLANHLPEPTSLHWHGLALRNDMDGVPGLTQRDIAPGADFAYRFAVPHPGTYWFHPHSGVQQDRGLYAPLIVEDPKEPLAYDKEWVVVLDDWVDGVDGSTPDAVLKELSGGMGGGMDHGAHTMSGEKDAEGDGPSRMMMGAASELLGGDSRRCGLPALPGQRAGAAGPVLLLRAARRPYPAADHQRRWRHRLPGRARRAPDDRDTHGRVSGPAHHG